MASLSSNTVPFNTSVPLGRTVDADAMFRLSTALAVSRVVLPAWPVDASSPSGAQAKDKLWSLLAHPEWDSNGYAHLVHVWTSGETPDLEGQIKNICKYRIWWKLFNDAAWRLVKGEPPRFMGRIYGEWSYASDPAAYEPTAYVLRCMGDSSAVDDGTDPYNFGGLGSYGWIDGSMQGYYGTFGYPLADVVCCMNEYGGYSGDEYFPLLPTLADEKYGSFWGIVPDSHRGNARDWWRTAAAGIGLDSWLPGEADYISHINSYYGQPDPSAVISLKTYRQMIDELRADWYLPFWFGDIPPSYWGDEGGISSDSSSYVSPGPLRQLKNAASWSGGHSNWADEFPYQGLCSIFSALYYLEKNSLGYIVRMSHEGSGYPGKVKHVDKTSSKVRACSATMTYVKDQYGNFVPSGGTPVVRAQFNSGTNSTATEYVTLNDIIIERKESRNEAIATESVPGPNSSWSLNIAWKQSISQGQDAVIADITNSSPDTKNFFHYIRTSQGATLSDKLDEACAFFVNELKSTVSSGDAGAVSSYDISCGSREYYELCDEYGGNDDSVDCVSRALMSSGAAYINRFVFFAKSELVGWSPQEGGPGNGGGSTGNGIQPWVEQLYEPFLPVNQEWQRMDNIHVRIWGAPGSASAKLALDAACKNVEAELSHRISCIAGNFNGSSSSGGDRFDAHAKGMEYVFPSTATLGEGERGVEAAGSMYGNYILRDGANDYLLSSSYELIRPKQGDSWGDIGFDILVALSAPLDPSLAKVVYDDGGSVERCESVSVWKEWLQSDVSTTPYSLHARGEITTPAAFVKFSEGRIC